jgi:hypothetical protein
MNKIKLYIDKYINIRGKVHEELLCKRPLSYYTPVGSHLWSTSTRMIDGKFSHKIHKQTVLIQNL